MPQDQIVHVIALVAAVLALLSVGFLAYYLGGQRARRSLAAELRPLLREEGERVVGQVVAAVRDLYARAERNRRYEGRGRGERPSA